LLDKQKADLWKRWKPGQSLSEIARALGKNPGSIHTVLASHGGIAPRERKRCAQQLTQQEREEISRGLAANMSTRSIAQQLGRAPSTISREINRNGGRHAYRAGPAEERAYEQARRPKSCALARNKRLRRVVADKLALQWSPQQISGWLKAEFENDSRMQVSHETIYRSLFIQARGVLKKELVSHLRTRRMMRRSKKATTKGQPRGQIVDAVPISKRPPEAQDRAVPGHWEGDLITGSNNSHIATLVERHSRFLKLVRVDGKDTTSVISALVREVRRLPEGLMDSLTWDRGSELANHRVFTMETDVDVFFCDPRSPWQRGTNENTNGLLRQYFPKGTDLSGYSQVQLDAVALRLNTRPRKTLDYRTPADKLMATVAMTG
jgi:IS30 family transposase